MPGQRVHPMIDPLLQLGSAPGRWLAATHALDTAMQRLGDSLQPTQALREPVFGGLLAPPMGSAIQQSLKDMAQSALSQITSEDAPPHAGVRPPSLLGPAAKVAFDTAVSAVVRDLKPPAQHASPGPARRPAPPRQPKAPPGPIAAEQARQTWQRRARQAGVAEALATALIPNAVAVGQGLSRSGLLGPAQAPLQAMGRAVVDTLAGSNGPMPTAANPQGLAGSLRGLPVHDLIDKVLQDLVGPLSNAEGQQRRTRRAHGAPAATSPRRDGDLFSRDLRAAAAAAVSGAAQRLGGAPQPSVSASSRPPSGDTVAPHTNTSGGSAASVSGLSGLRGLAARAAAAGTTAAATNAMAEPPQRTDNGTAPEPGNVALAMNDEQLAVRLARLLRREAQRDGIDVDDLRP